MASAGAIAAAALVTGAPGTAWAAGSTPEPHSSQSNKCHQDRAHGDSKGQHENGHRDSNGRHEDKGHQNSDGRHDHVRH
ncbi:hypothetical protein KN815_38565, partial [Streptomyces sp. 4503]|nr:hypothetical protein [Streptomyces niphimycinicus]